MESDNMMASQQDLMAGVAPVARNNSGSGSDDDWKKVKGLEGAGEDIVFEEKVQPPIVDTAGFTVVMGAVVMINVVFIGMQTDLESEDVPIDFATLNSLFLLIYMGELATRLLLKGLESFRSPLTVLDGTLVMAAFLEQVTSGGGFARALPALRLFRLFKLFFSLKMFHGSRELELLVNSGHKVGKAFFWMILTLTILLWSAGVVVTNSIGKSAEWIGTMDPLVDHEPFESFDVREYFGSVSRSFLTLLQLVTQANFAFHVGHRVLRVYPMISGFFYFLTFVSTYGLVQGVIGIIVQDSLSASKAAEAAKKEMHKENRRNMGKQVLNILNLIDLDGDGTLTHVEIRQALENPDVPLIPMLLELQVPPSLIDAHNLVRIFDRDGDGTVNYEEMVSGLVRMDDDVIPRDFQKLHMRVQYVFARAEMLLKRTERLSAQVCAVKDYIEACCIAINHMMETRDATDLRRRAVMQIRNAPPGIPPPPSMWEKPPLERPSSGSGNLFMYWSRRFLGAEREKPDSPHSHKSREVEVPERNPGDPPLSATVVNAIVCGRGVLGEPPQPLEVEKAEAKRIYKAQADEAEDKYKLEGARTNRRLVALKGLIAGDM